MVWVIRRRPSRSGTISTDRRYPSIGPPADSNRPGPTARSSTRPSRARRNAWASASDPTSAEVTTRLTSEDVRAPRRQVGAEHGVGAMERAVRQLGEPPGLGQDRGPDRAEEHRRQLTRAEHQVRFGVGAPARCPVGAALELPPAGVPVTEVVLELED